ncbi:hypothetical protein PVAND_000571 [Polypedilum vanderplanki]|uniref:Cytochrome P450 n=1 Tax=Polypedilum vanderplanki TaxID=319348 RepID=A0A9J6BKZ6_POLVA|nr:hypothetical protein PVAND_000571 [Polypedilum vanderplanki]
MDLLLYLIILMFSAMFWYRKKYGQRNELLEKFQAPEKSMPILRHSFMLINKTPSQILNVFSELAEKCGPVWRFDFSPFTSMITVHDPKILEQILSSQKLIDKSDGYDNISNWLGNGLLMSTGAKWHQRRKIITPTFHFKILEEFVEIMNKHGNVFVKKLKKYNGRPIDVFPLVSLYALDVICESAMGYQLNAQIDDTSEYVKAVKEMASIAFLKSFNVIKRIKFLYQFSNTCKREKVVVEKLHDFTNSVISARRKYLKQREFMADNEKNKDDNDEIGMKKKTAFLAFCYKFKLMDNH